MLTAEEHVARDILAVRNRVAHWRKGIEPLYRKYRTATLSLVDRSRFGFN